jgi:hypothetical protein
LRSQGVEHQAPDGAQSEHNGVELLISELMTHPVDWPFYDAKVRVPSSYVQHHVGEESGEGVFARAAAGVDMRALAPRLSHRKAELVKSSEGVISGPRRCVRWIWLVSGATCRRM